MYYFKNNNNNRNFNDFDNGAQLFKKVQSGKMKLEEMKKLQVIFKANLNRILKGRFKSEEQKRALENIKLLYESRKATIELFNKYSSIASEAKYKTKYGECLKILNPKQMLQRLPMALAQVKVGNTSENLLNEIRQTTYSLYRANEIIKKVYKNIMNSIKA